jgi:RNA polymerase sigma factor (sigma-70 family)
MIVRTNSLRNSVKGNDEIVAQPFEDVVIDKILCESLRNALNKLSVEEYKLIYELYYQDMTERQVATAIGISQVAVHKRKNKILNKLKQLIGE